MNFKEQEKLVTLSKTVSKFDWIREFWSYRELLYFFVWRDVKVKYKQTVFGALWAIIQPFSAMIVFTIYSAIFQTEL